MNLKFVKNASRRFTFFVIPAEFDFFPESRWKCGAFDGLHVEIADSVLFLDRRILTVCQRTALTRTDP